MIGGTFGSAKGGMTMVRKKKTLLVAILITAVAALMTMALVAVPPAVLAWRKASAHRIFARLSPEDRRSLNATPTTITLPKADPNDPPLTNERLGAFTLHFPAPQSRELKLHSLILSYPQFTATFLIPRSTTVDDATYRELFHQDYWPSQVQINHVRLDDIDAQPDRSRLENVVKLLAAKPTRFALRTYFVEFAEEDRCGMIRARDEKMQQILANIVFPHARTSCGIWFGKDSGLNPAEVQRFLSAIQIGPTPGTTTAAK
jgi:hypothetical protein